MPDVARLIKEIIDNEFFDLPDPLNIGQQDGVSILDSAIMAKEALNYDVVFDYDMTKQDGAPIKVLGNKRFKEVFPNFEFTDVSEGIKNTINYYKEHLS